MAFINNYGNFGIKTIPAYCSGSSNTNVTVFSISENTQLMQIPITKVGFKLVRPPELTNDPSVIVGIQVEDADSMGSLTSDFSLGWYNENTGNFQDILQLEDVKISQITIKQKATNNSSKLKCKVVINFQYIIQN